MELFYNNIIEILKVIDIKGVTACIFIILMSEKGNKVIDNGFGLINTILCNRDNMIYRFGSFCKYLITPKIKKRKK